MHAVAPYTCIINASTAFRAFTAVHSYDTSALLPMNEAEAAEVCKILISRAGVALSDSEAQPFPSPLALSGDGIDNSSLNRLNESLGLFGRYNHPHRDPGGQLSLAYPISFGLDGGLIIGVNGRMIACFTSILSPSGEERLFEEYGFDREEGLHESGAGDSVAALVALFNTISPEIVTDPYFRGAERDRKDFRHLTGTIFVGILSRIVGNILVRTKHTNMAGLNEDMLGRLFADVAQQAVEQARILYRTLPQPVFTVVEKWGIRSVLWSPSGSFF